jgi:sugar phosphate isomerase/epimerase
MVTCGFPRIELKDDLELARRIGAEVVEILPDWRNLPDGANVGRTCRGAGLAVHSVHGCWGGQSIRASRVDLGSTDPAVRAESVDDIRRCIEWSRKVGARVLVVHPGGLSQPVDQEERQAALADSLRALAGDATSASIQLCVENMPPGVHPGCRMLDLHLLLDNLAEPSLALALDTGHGHLNGDLRAETRAAGNRLATTHVHDNNGRRDSHEPPGQGSIDWRAWAASLDEIQYDGPVVLECVRALRQEPSLFDAAVLAPLLGSLE